MINRLAGLADEMGSFYRKVKEREIEHLEHMKETQEKEPVPTEPAVSMDNKQDISDKPLTPSDMLHALLHE